MVNPAKAECDIEITPFLIVGEPHADNILRKSKDEQFDYITTASPGVKARIDSTKNRRPLDYFPTWAWYQDLAENNRVRHELVHPRHN